MFEPLSSYAKGIVAEVHGNMEKPPEEEGIFQWQKHNEVPKDLKKYFLIFDMDCTGVRIFKLTGFIDTGCSATLYGTAMMRAYG
jgi:hypothetical protein